MTMLSTLILQTPFANGGPSLSIDRANGRFTVEWHGASVRDAHGEARLADGRLLRTDAYPRHEVQTGRVRDRLGESMRIVVRHLGGGPELRQTFWLLKNRPEIVARLDLLDGGGTNEIASVVTGEPVLPDAPQTLFVPYDNDAYIRYRSDAKDATSHEVSARYDAASRRGLVVGSVDHDVWKSGVSFAKGLRAYGGFVDKDSRDTQLHGTVTGGTVQSPRFVLGYYDDWRTGMERYGDLNALVQPPLPWKSPVPFGWNSWGAHKAELKAVHGRTATDFLVHDLPMFRDGGTAYVNFDSFWDNLSAAERREFVRRAHAAGLKAGIYWTPFVAWGGLESPVGDGKYRYRDLALKDAKGKPLPKLDGGWPLDPTHPGTLTRIDRQMKEFVADGYDFVKLDFMTHGALEGRHFDPQIKTGTQAYAIGMKRIVDDLAPKKIGRPFFISLSIAPLFPSGFAHSRRISCDVFSNIGASEYLLNSSTYAWWQADRLYRFNDPDHTVVYQPLGEPPTTDAEARTRLLGSVISGGMLLNSDDLSKPAAQARVRRLFTDPAILALARKAPAFRPVEGDSGDKSGDAFVWRDGKAVYVAAFNFGKENKAKSVPLARLGLKGKWRETRLFGGSVRMMDGEVAFDLQPMDCALVRLEPAR